jgi:acetylornithine/succinyldiaminopimelate/putrescine aminotransferase/predicted amino acid dehydrogenase
MTHAETRAYESGEFESAKIRSLDDCDDNAERYDSAAKDYAQFVNPHLSDLLERLRLDKCFVRGEQHRLFDAEGAEYLDAISGYGAVPFGHNPGWLWAAIHDFERSHEPAMAQPSLMPGAGELAEALIRHAPPGMRAVAFGNSGAEAVEAAIKACRIATRKLGVISTENGFHGKTLGALSATGRPFFQEGCGAPVAGFRLVPYGDADALEAAFERHAKETAAFVVEPIQGEGGVVEAPAGYLRLARGLCDRYGVLLVVDEVQTGLGRTGTLFACEAEGITPDAMTLAKALGGGLVPISACLLSSRAYTKDFAFKHSSTFGGNGLATRVGLRVVERLVSDPSILENVVRQGSYLKRGLRALQREFGSVVRDVRGRGLMLGVELAIDASTIERGRGSFMAMLGEGLALFAASHMLNSGRVRVAPTLNGAHVLRIQPPLTVTRDECDWILRAFRDTASIMASGRSDRLVDPIVAPPSRLRPMGGVFEACEPRATAVVEVPAEGRFAFIVHLLDTRSLVDFDEALGGLNPSELDALSHRFEDSAKPFVASRVRIESPTGQIAVGDFVVLPKTSAQLLHLRPEEAFDEVAAAVTLAKERGAKIVGLGGYTSVVTTNVLGLLKLGPALTTGNGYTVVSAIDAAVEASRLTGRKLDEHRAAIVGGAGSIGSALASLLAERVASLVLVGRDGDAAAALGRYAVILTRMVRHLAGRRKRGFAFREGSLADRLSRVQCMDKLFDGSGRLLLTNEGERAILDETRDLPIRWTTDLPGAVRASDMIFLATSTPEPLLDARAVQPGTVICDLSRPANVGDDLHRRDDVMVIDGGIVEVPGRPNLGFHFGLATGLAYACMAETMMLGLEQRYEHTSLGRDLQESSLDLLRSLASKHEFRLADLRARQRPLMLGTRAGRLRRVSA